MDYILLSDLAIELGLDRSNVRKYVIKHGFNLVSVRTPQSHNQLTLALTTEDAEAVRALRSLQGFNKKITVPVDNGVGFFYVIQVVPDLMPNRIKLGFTIDVISRLAAHQTAAPTAKLVKNWPCKRTWEICAIASITRKGCKLLANEVYECDDLPLLIKRSDAFFNLMPNLNVDTQ